MGPEQAPPEAAEPALAAMLASERTDSMGNLRRGLIDCHHVIALLQSVAERLQQALGDRVDNFRARKVL